jgi:DNA-binding beta-propeller fold protein YncE
VACVALLGLLASADSPSRAQDSSPQTITDFDQPTYSSPIAMDVLKNLIWVVNPDDDSVSVIGDLDGTPEVLRKFFVGDEPQSIALDTNDADPTKYRVYVANAADNGISIINVTASAAGSVTAVLQEDLLITGAEPWNIVASPDGTRVFVANSVQDTITVIRTDTQAIVGNVTLNDSVCNVGDPDRHFQPRGLAVTENNDRLYVTRFLSFTKSGGVQGRDDGKEGIVCQLNIPADIAALPTVVKAISLGTQPTGFDANIGTPPVSTPTFAYPNQLQSIVIRGNQAYLPNIASSPSGPLRFNVDTQAFVNVIDNAAFGDPVDASADKFVNMHLGARDPELGKKRLFFANPWAIAFTNESGTGNAYVVSAGSDLLVKLEVDAAGVLTFTEDISTTRYIDLNDPANPETSGANAGKNPLGIVIRETVPDNVKAFIMNYVSRNVSVVDIPTDAVVDVIRTTNLPLENTIDEQLQVGKEIFFASRGHFDRPAGTTISTDERLSSEGWQNCASCHFAGLTDGNIWAFAAGPRKSVPLNGTFSPHNPDDQRLLNYSAIFDSVPDFEINIRNVSGRGNLSPGPPPVLDPTQGLIVSDTGDINFAPAVVPPFIPIDNAGRPQHTVTLPGSTTAWPALDAMNEWVRFAIRTPNGALTTDELTAGGGNPTGGLDPALVTRGRRRFFRAGCQECHGGTKWTISSKDFTSPPALTELFTEAGAANTVQAQYLNRFLSDIDSFELGVAGGPNPIDGNVGAVEFNDVGLNALGKDHNGDGAGNGFNIPSLLGILHVPPYYHNGACETLDCVLTNVTHRTSGPGIDDILADPNVREQLVIWLKTLDADTPFPLDFRIRPHHTFIDPPVVFQGEQVVVGANLKLFGTRADFANLLEDLGLPGVTVRFELSPVEGASTVDALLLASSFTQDFGQGIVTATWQLPAVGVPAPAIGSVIVTIDPDNEFPEAREDNNRTRRRTRILPPPADTTPPVVTQVRISDDDPFNDNDLATASTDVQIKIVANDPDPAGPEAPSGLDGGSYCIVAYRYDNVEREWEPSDCTFTPLPAASPADTFIVDAELQDYAGVAYAFVWVKDEAGNISSAPGFDVISVIPPTPIDLNRNDVTILRLLLEAGQNISLTVNLAFGDVDVSVFEDFTDPGAARCGLSANNGPVDEQVTLPGLCADGPPHRLQVEIRAFVNSRFTIGLTPVAASVTSSAVSTPDADLPETPTVAGPPSLRAAIDAEGFEASDVFLPLVDGSE